MKKLFIEWKNPLLILSAIAVFGLLIRIQNLTSFPIFADEAIYIRWAQIMRNEPSLRFLPLSDGKQPLFMWFAMVGLKFFADPLFAGRIVSVMSGLGVMIGIFVLSYLLFKKKSISILASFFYTISPYTVFFDRMALVDSMLSMFGIWMLIFSILSIRLRRFDFAMLAGFSLGGAFLTKSPALFFLILLPFTALVVDWPKKVEDKKKYFINLIPLWMTTGIIGYVIYNILRLGPNFHMVTSRNMDYVYPYSHILTRPLDPFLPYLDRALEWVELLGPYLLVALAIVGAIRSFKNHRNEILFLIILTLVPVFISAEFAKVFTARYILFVLPTFMILAASSLTDFKNAYYKFLLIAIIAIITFQALKINYIIFTDPVNSSLPPNEKSGYLEEWSSGTGIKEASDILKSIAKSNADKHIVIGTEGSFGTLPDGLQIYLEKIPNITVIGVGLDISKIPLSLVESKKAGNLTYLVANSSRLRLDQNNFEKYGLSVIYSIKKAKRRVDTHEYSGQGPQDTFYLLELKEIL